MSAHYTRTNIAKTIGWTNLVKVVYIYVNQMLISFEQQKKVFDLWVFLCLIFPAEFCGLTLVDARCFSKSKGSLDRQVTWESRWSPVTLTRSPTKFDYHCLFWWVVKLEMHLFANITWSHNRWVTWLDSCGQLNISHTLLILVAIVLAKVEIKLFLISRDHIISHVSRWVR